MLPSVDRVIDQVPLVGDIVLGKDKSLIGFAVHITGNWDEPEVQVLAPSAIQKASGWARELIGSGAGQIRRIFVGPDESAVEEESDEGTQQDFGP